MAKTMLSDASQIDRLQMELQDLDRKIDAQSSKLSSGLFCWMSVFLLLLVDVCLLLTSFE